MAFANLPRPVAVLLSSLGSRDRAASCGVFADDAHIVDRGVRHQGQASIADWVDSVVDIGSRIHPIHVAAHEGATVVTFWARRERSDSQDIHAEQLEWKLALRNDRIASLTIEEKELPALPGAVTAYVRAVNAFDLEKLVGTFADDALVNDQLIARWGREAIREWAAREIVADKVTMHVVGAVSHYDSCIVTANVDGAFDKRGLPDPFVMTFYFTSFQGRLVRLIILRANP